MSYPASTPHDPIEEILPDVFMVRGSVRMNPLVTITRNMAIVRHEGELSLIDPIRLDEAGEGQLRELGDVNEPILVHSDVNEGSKSSHVRDDPLHDHVWS